MKTIKLNILLISLIIGLAVYSCSTNEKTPDNQGKTEEHAGHEHEAKTSTEASPNEALHALEENLAENQVLITEKQLQAVEIQMGKVTKQQLSKVVKSFGELVLAPSDEASVNALVGGIIKDIRFIEGDYVKEGQVLARIVHPDIVDMQQDYLEAHNQNDYLKAEYQRQKRLLEDSVNAQKTVQEARSAYQSNLARLNSLRKKLELIHINPDELTPQHIHDGYALKAPISGFVAQVNINTGKHVTPQQSLFYITANEKAHIDLKVYEKDIGKIAPGQKLTFNLANNQTNKPLEGEVIKTAKSFDPEERTATVHARVKEMSDKLLPGMSVVAYIQTGGKQQLTLPGAAFVSEQGKDYVFMLKRKGSTGANHEAGKAHQHTDEAEGNQAHEKHANNTGTHFYIFEKVQVAKGITQGTVSSFTTNKSKIDDARFAINNAQALLSEMKTSSGGHGGHAH